MEDQPNISENPSEPNPELKSKPTAFEEFAKSSTAGKLSGKIHQTKGFFKRKVGEITNDVELKAQGQNQELLGKVHSLVGSVRAVKEVAIQKALTVREDGKKLLQKHGAKLLDQATEFVEDVKKTFF